jgi:hypothetical protein
MVEHVNKQDDVEAAVGVRYRLSIERLHEDRRIAAPEDIDSRNRNIGSRLLDHSSKSAVAAAHIEHLRIRRNELGAPIAEDSDSPLMNESPVNRFD